MLRLGGNALLIELMNDLFFFDPELLKFDVHLFNSFSGLSILGLILKDGCLRCCLDLGLQESDFILFLLGCCFLLDGNHSWVWRLWSGCWPEKTFWSNID